MAFNPPFRTLAAVWQRLFFAQTDLLRRVHGAQGLRRKVVQGLDHQVGLVECSGGFWDEMVGADDTFYAGGACRAITGNRVLQRENGLGCGAQFLDRSDRRETVTVPNRPVIRRGRREYSQACCVAPSGMSARMQPQPGRDFTTMRIIVLGHQPGPGVRVSARFSEPQRCLHGFGERRGRHPPVYATRPSRVNRGRRCRAGRWRRASRLRCRCSFRES